MVVLRIVQTSTYNWHIEAPKGHVLKEGLSFHTSTQAEDYIKKYVTSWPNWRYEVVPL